MNDIEIHFDGRTYAIDDFELGELEWLEEFLDAPLADLGALNSMKAAIGFVYLIKRHGDPEFTLDQARKTKLRDLAHVADAPDTTAKNAAKRPPKRAAR